jgi:hypothetical protein
VKFENGAGKSQSLRADLIVDASGRGNLTLALLEAIGRAQAQESVIEVDIGYATAIFAIPADMSVDWVSGHLP